jgi:hypothetical protein
MSMEEGREARLLAVFNDLPDDEKEAVLAFMEKIRQRENTITLADISLHKGIETVVTDGHR